MTATARSSANPAQTALATRLAARDELEDALVRIGLPAEVPSEPDRVYIASVDDLTRSKTGELAAIPRIYAESYDLVLLIECHRPGSISDAALQDETNTRMWQMVAEVEEELADNQELAADVDTAYVSAIPTAHTLPAPDGWIGKAIVHVHVDGLCNLGRHLG